MNLIIVSGPEATGKTYIARQISSQLGYAYQSKDVIKETIYDTYTRSTWDYGWYESEAKQEFLAK
ncbi:hypothetical protein EOL96_01325 [Candidatus Saccharibacteria bacterium]|nr:hypothetical protein [Candidatus Saccharibacteria bacterium]